MWTCHLIHIGETLLFIDEIQESLEAIQMLRYFYEEFPDLHVIAAGSLLEFTMKKVKNFPVGRVEYLYLHPLNFEEYLIHDYIDVDLNIVWKTASESIPGLKVLLNKLEY